jgi:MFS family permease
LVESVNPLSRAAAAPSVPRPGESLPGGSAPLAAAPAFATSRTSRLSPPALRASLRASHAEGMSAELCGACVGGAVMTAWALHLGAGTLVIGLLGALPLAAQVLQLPAAWLTHRLGYRRVAIAGIAASRLVWLPLAALPFVDLPPAARLQLYVAIFAAAAVLGVLGNNAWTAWMGDLVPGSLRGRFFSRRTVYLSLAGTVASLATGVLLDVCVPRGWKEETLAALVVVAAGAAVVSVVLLLRQADPSAGAAASAWEWSALIGPLRDAAARPFLRYLLAWNGAVALSASFFSLHMLQTLQTGFALAAAHGVAVAMVRIAAAPLWGRTVDRLGGRPVLQVCSVGIAFVPAIWLFATPDRLWPLAIEAVVAGTLWGGHGIAAMDLTLGLSPRRQRAFYVAVFAAAGGLGFAVASVLAGALAWRLPSELPLLGLTWTSLHALFFLSSLGRAAAAVLAWRIAERDARPAGDVLRALPGEITRLLGSPVGARRSWRRPSHTAAG